MPPLNPINRTLFNSKPRAFAENIDRVIQHGGMPSGPHPQLSMPAFGDTNTLTQQQIADIEAYVLRANRVDRARLANPGLPPQRFFLLVVAVFGLAGLGLGGRWMWIRTHRKSNTP